MPTHNKFERRCSAPELAGLSIEDFEGLTAHMGQCEPCRAYYEEHLQAAAREHFGSLPAGEGAEACAPAAAANYRMAFLLRAKSEGVQFSPGAMAEPAPLHRLSAWTWAWKPGLGAALVVVLVIAAAGYRRSRTVISRQQARLETLTGKVADLARAGAQLRQQVAEQTRGRFSLESNIADAQSQRDLALARAKTLQLQLAQSSAGATALRANLAGSKASTADLQRQNQAAQRDLSSLNDEIESLRAANRHLLMTGDAGSAQVKVLSDRVQRDQTAIARDEQLLLASHDITNLMGARNLRIIDVFDADGNGGSGNAFGRVFYTEGKSLVFYAFDLGNPTPQDTNVSYVGWGKKASSGAPTRALGIFYIDNAAQHRWVLRFDNPDVLRKIDAVFVTVEPSGSRKVPTGRTLLYAYLNTPVNHP